MGIFAAVGEAEGAEAAVAGWTGQGAAASKVGEDLPTAWLRGREKEAGIVVAGKEVERVERAREQADSGGK